VNWYDRADEYDILFGWDPARECDFVLGASARWGIPEPRRILEPFCGSARLIGAMPGFAVGLDLNPHMLRIARHRARVVRADAARFAFAEGSFDLAFCLIDSFRHLHTEDEAHSHLACMGRALRPGAVYVLGLEVTGDVAGGDHTEETWSMERDGVRIDAKVQGLADADPHTRIETVHIVTDVGGERREFFNAMRVYGREDLQDLIDEEGSFEIAAAFDRGYDLENPVELDEIAGSAILVLRRE